MSGPALLDCENLEVFYGKYLQVLRGVSIRMKAKEAVAVLGPNGAGKTTLIHTIMGLIDDQPERGKVHFAGQLINTWDTSRRVQSGLGCVPEGRMVFADLTVRDNLLMGGWVAARSTLEDRLEQAFARFPRLRERHRQLAGTLSGGEQQMLAIARALMSQPSVLLLDEPSLGLAPRVVQEIFEILKELVTEGIAILLVEQNAQVALRFSHHAYILESGRIVLNGLSSDLIDNADVREFYLGLGQVESIKGYRRFRRRKRWA